jgi:hypothetical protein
LFKIPLLNIWKLEAIKEDQDQRVQCQDFFCFLKRESDRPANLIINIILATDKIIKTLDNT